MPTQTKRLVLNQETLWRLTGTSGIDTLLSGTQVPTTYLCSFDDTACPSCEGCPP